MRRSTGQLPLAFKIGKVILAIMILFAGFLAVTIFLDDKSPRMYGLMDLLDPTRLYIAMMMIFWGILVCMAMVLAPALRRMRGMWFPPILPRVRHRGFTLIELLIVIAIVAILMPPFAKLASQARMASERESLSRESLALAQDEFAWLRGQPALPAERGTHPIAPEVAAMHRVVAPMAKVEISPTSGPLVQVRVTVDLASKGIRTPVSLAALIAPRKEVKP